MLKDYIELVEVEFPYFFVPLFWVCHVIDKTSLIYNRHDIVSILVNYWYTQLFSKNSWKYE